MDDEEEGMVVFGFGVGFGFGVELFVELFVEFVSFTGGTV